MAERRSAHIFGPSTLLSADLGSDKTLLALTREALAAGDPEVAWDCRASVLYINPGMDERLTKMLSGGDKPDVVVFRFPQNQYISDYLIYRVRELWPWAFRRSVRLAELMIRLAGGGPAGSPSARGLIFRAPRWLLTRLIGVAPAVRVEAAVDLVKASIDAVLRMEDVHLVYLMSTQTVQPNVGAEEARRRREYFTAKVAAHCDQRGVPWLDPARVYAEAGRVRGLAEDRWHSTLNDRSFDASILAQVIRQAAEGRRTLEVSV